MKRSIILGLALALGLVLSAGSAHAQTAFQFAAPGLRAPDNPDVSGMRFSVLHGQNRNQRGFDLGLLSMSESSRVSGLAMIAGIHRVTGDMPGGAAFSFVNWHGGSDSGMNGAFVNVVNETSRAFNLAFVTVAQGATAVDLGGFNMSKSSRVQIGFLNITDEIKAFQFGFLNIAPNGFLPVFPIFNFPRR